MKNVAPIKHSIVAIIGFISMGVYPTSANAATWHQGTPKVLRGMYQSHRENAAEGFGPVTTITSKSVALQASNWPLRKTVHVKYRVLKSHLYLIKGHMQKWGFVLAGPASNVYYLKGKKLLVTDYASYQKDKMKAFRYARKNPAIKTTHVKNNGPVIHFG